MVKERISEVEERSINIIQYKLLKLTHEKKNKSKRHKTQHPKAVGQYQSKPSVTGIPEGKEEENEAEETYEEIMDEKFPTIT